MARLVDHMIPTHLHIVHPPHPLVLSDEINISLIIVLMVISISDNNEMCEIAHGHLCFLFYFVSLK